MVCLIHVFEVGGVGFVSEESCALLIRKKQAATMAMRRRRGRGWRMVSRGQNY